MKKIILLFMLVFCVQPILAECSESSIEFFPKQKKISLNPFLILEKYSFFEDSFKAPSIYLKSENGEEIELIVHEKLKGQMNLNQAVYCPTESLQPNTLYYLKYKKPNEDNLRKRIYWITKNYEYVKNIDVDLSIKFYKNEIMFLGCGNSINAIFKIQNEPKSEIWYKTEVINTVTNEKNTFYILGYNGQIDVGHGMCAGAFTYNIKGKYKVRFTATNIDGHPLQTTNWISFKNPLKNT